MAIFVSTKQNIMRLLLFILIVVVLVNSNSSCNSSGPKAFCDTVCISDTIKFKGNHVLQPYVYVTAKNCKADTIVWSYSGYGTNRKMGIADIFGAQVNINKNFIGCFIKDTSYTWILFNDCATGRGYQVKLPFNKTAKIERKSSGINRFDPKFFVEENLIVNTDKGNVFVEDQETGKKAMMTFGQKLEIDFDAIHQLIDSVNITSTRIWVKVKKNNEWIELEKKISLE